MQRAPVQRLHVYCQRLNLLSQRCINTDIDGLLGRTLVRKFLVRNTSSATRDWLSKSSACGSGQELQTETSWTSANHPVRSCRVVSLYDVSWQHQLWTCQFVSSLGIETCGDTLGSSSGRMSREDLGKSALRYMLTATATFAYLRNRCSMKHRWYIAGEMSYVKVPGRSLSWPGTSRILS